MTDQQLVIDIEGTHRAVIQSEDSAWLGQLLAGGAGSTRLRLREDVDSGDTEGHGFAGTLVRVIAEGDDDTEGHVLSIQFPSREEADDFRRRLLLTGVLAGTVALGVVTGMGLGALANGAAPGVGAAQAAAPPVEHAWSQDERQLTDPADEVEWTMSGDIRPPRPE